ncbi:MAG TPA: hypothetical protein VIG88_14015 [Lysobacter sp.]
MTVRALERRGLRADIGDRHPCGTRVRYVGGCRCDACRQANREYERERGAARRAGDWNGLVDARLARAHLLKLSRQGVGRRAAAAASDVALSLIGEIRTGRKKQIRARTERRLLAVTVEMISDRTLVDAKKTWALIDELLEEQFTEAQLARWLGYHTPRLQFGRDQVTARNAADVANLYRRLMS